MVPQSRSSYCASKNPSIDARVVDLEAGEFTVTPQSFDLVLSCYYLQRDLIPLMQSALRPGGLLIMIVHLADADQPRRHTRRARTQVNFAHSFKDGASCITAKANPENPAIGTPSPR